ncbi:transcriptional repressor NrdR [Candidatus Dojkabacteria bacterium]|uniref:Transcriptional repressor NrdR n=1 Tax=Candidatus Dojkabacteria bacterium TaxID=2099670 RepID=A0A955RM91_9BACT|nr:transcriptional repressor NrdR [Candidatus Dojkabacteria bacterium]
MYCPYCKSKQVKVIDKRDNEDTNTSRRRRECESCLKRFTTYERVEKVLINVIKRDGRVEEFDREKMKLGIFKAIKKRSLTEDTVEEIIQNVENKLIGREDSTVRSIDIGEFVLEELTKVDKLGALLFASVYKEFKTLEDVQKELEKFSN